MTSVETLTIKVKTDGISKAKSDINFLGTAADNTEKKVIKLVDSVNKMVAQFTNSVSSTKALTNALSVVNKSTTASDAAMKHLATSVASLSTQIGILSTRMDAGSASVRTNTVNINHHTREMNAAHAAARGLAGSMGALWLTYGSIVPLAAGAALGASFMAVLKNGVALEDTLQSIAVKGQVSAESMAKLKETIADLGQGIYGPQEVAAALETLVLAGLSAENAVKGVGAALNLAVVGGTSIEKAAYTLVQVGTAMGYTSDSFSTIGNVIAKTAATSMSSVESLSEAFKSASSVGVVYGVTLKDLAVNLATLSNLGIQGTAAGTAVKNFYKELDSGSDRVVKTLAKVGVVVERDLKVDGKFKDINTIVQVLSDSMDKFGDAGGQALQKITNERGMRSIAAMLQAYRTEIGETSNAFRTMSDEIANSAGLVEIGAAQRATSSKNLMTSTLNTMKTSFVEAFEAMAPSLNIVANELKKMFSSSEFKSGLSSAISGLSSLFAFISQNIPTIVNLGIAFLGVKAAMLALSVASTVVAGLTAVGKAIEFATGTTVTFTTVVKALQATFLPLLAVMATVTAAMALYSWVKKEALDTKVVDQATNSNKTFIDSLNSQAKSLEVANKNLQENTNLKVANAKTTAELALAEVAARNKSAVDSAQNQYNGALKNLGKLSHPQSYAELQQAGSFLKKVREQAKKDMEDAEKAVSRVQAASLANDKLSEEAQAREAERLKARANLAANLAGNPEIGTTKADPAIKKALSFLQQEQLELEKVTAKYNARARALVASYLAGERIAAESQQAMVMVNKEEGKYLSEAIYLKQMKLAKDADEAKANFDRINQYVEIGQKISNIIEGEKTRAELAAKGQDSGKLTAQVAAMAKYNNISADQLRIDIERAQVADKILETNDKRNRLESATNSSKQRGEQYADELATLEKYGIVLKQTAVEFAKAEIAKQGFSDDSFEGQARLAAAGLEDVNKALLEMQKTYSSLQRDMGEQAGINLEAVIGVEQAKVEAYRNTAEKAIEYQQASAQAGVIAQMEAGKLNAMQAAGELAMISAQFDKVRDLMGEKFAIDFKVAGLKDVANIFDDMADAADRLGDKFAGPVKALDSFSRGFKNLAKIEEQERKSGQKFTAERVGAYGDMLDGAKNFFKEGTFGYKALEKASQVASAVQIAMNIKTMASNAASAVTGVIAGAAQMFAQSGWGGFAGVAAMLGVMAALGFSGGTSGVQPPSSEERQKTQGTGSVFGDSGAKSESISKSLEYLTDNSDIMLPLTSQMAKSLQNIEASMAGLGNLILRTGGVMDGSNFGINEGTFANVGGAFGKALNGIIGGDPLTKALFGKTTKKITDSGISFGGSVDALQAGQGYSQYADVETTKKRLLGLSKKTSYNTETQALNEELSNQFGLIFTSLEDSLKLAAGGFGKSGTQVGDAISNMVIEQTTLSLKDLKGDELTEAINSVISKTMDDIAKAAFPDLGGFQQIGEGYAQTVIRVASGIEQAGVALDAFNIKAVGYTDIVNKQGDVAAEIFTQSVVAFEQFQGVRDIVKNLTGDVSELAATYTKLVDARNQLNNTGLNGGGLNSDTIKGAGGLDALADSIADYQENFFTEAERNAMAFADLTREFGALNVALPASKDALKALIQEASNSGNQGLLGSLLALSGAFAEASDKATELAGGTTDAAELLNKQLAMFIQLATLEGNTSGVAAAVAEQRRIEMEALDASLRPMQSRIWLLQDEQKLIDKMKANASNALTALQKSVNAQKTAQQEVAAKQKEAAQEQLTIAQEALSAIDKVFGSLTSAIESTRIESDALDKARRQSAQVYLQSLNGTDLTKAVGLDGALSDVSGESQQFFSTFEDYARDQAKTANIISTLQAQAGTQKSLAELTVERLNDSIEAIEKASQAELERLDSIVENAQAQLDTLNGLATALLPLPMAIDNMATALSLLKTVQNAATGTIVDSNTGAATRPDSVVYKIESLYNNLLGRKSEEAGMQHWLTQYTNGASLSDITNSFLGSDEYKSKHPSFAVGINEVPYDMTANVHKGERIMPAADNAELMRRLDQPSSSDSSEVKAAIKELAEVIQAGDLANVQRTGELLKIVKKWDLNGIPEERNVTN